MPALLALHDHREMTGPPYDARAIANVLVEFGKEQDCPLSNLSLQKVLYFAHGLYLSRYGRPLVEGYFEAWEHGPVHPLVYHAFKNNGAAPITDPADRFDLRTRTRKKIEGPDKEEVRHFLREVSRTYGRLSASQLVTWSHRKGAPWHSVVGSGPEQKKNYGLRIDNGVIQKLFVHHKLTVASVDHDGEVREELPPAAD